MNFKGLYPCASYLMGKGGRSTAQPGMQVFFEKRLIGPMQLQTVGPHASPAPPVLPRRPPGMVAVGQDHPLKEAFTM
jgi:hypothetical protein